jgi:hypothetical protein
MIKRYALLKPMPQHSVGDIVYKPHPQSEYYYWEGEEHITTPFKLPAELVECSEFFQEVNDDWKGDLIYFISMEGGILEEDYNHIRHKGLIEYGNAFHTQEEAEAKRSMIMDLNKGKGVFLSTTQLDFIQLALENDNVDVAKKMVEHYIITAKNEQ